jgi:hypothetical protein
MTLLLGAGLIGASVAIPTYAQEANPGGGQGGGRGRGNAADWRKQMEDRMKADMAVSEDEWKVLQPKIEKVRNLQRDAMIGRFGGMGRGRGGDNNNAEANNNPITKAASELRTLLEKKDATAEDIKAKLTALREAKKKVAEDLTKAQTELREVATVRVEAVLVRDGVLD